MPIMTTQPVPDPDGDYDRLGVNLAISPYWKLQDVGGSVAVRMTPYRVNADGNVEQCPDQDHQRSVVYADAFVAAQNDPALAVVVTKIMMALQEFIVAKGL